LDVYRAYIKTTVKPDVRKQLTPINPKLDREVIEKLGEKREILFEEIIEATDEAEKEGADSGFLVDLEELGEAEATEEAEKQEEL
jgi:hypothetical protein